MGVVHVDGVADADGRGGDVSCQLRLPWVLNIKLAATRRSRPVAHLLKAWLEGGEARHHLRAELADALG